MVATAVEDCFNANNDYRNAAKIKQHNLEMLMEDIHERVLKKLFFKGYDLAEKFEAYECNSIAQVELKME